MPNTETTPFTIRDATTNDIPELVQFIHELAAYEHLSAQCLVTPENLQAALFGPRPCGEALLGVVADQPVAFAVFFQNLSTFLGKPGLYLEDLFVRPAFRRRGYARSILEHLARLANQRGCGRFEWTVLDWNKPAIDFYQRLGAQLLPDWRVCRLAGEQLARFGT
jgi:GNAT superfamily N-acetyltransferase